MVVKICIPVLGTFVRRDVVEFLGKMGTAAATFPAITAKNLAFAPILIFELFWTTVAMARGRPGSVGKAKGRTSV